MSNKYYVYSYSEAGKSEPFYIGKGSGNRLTDHFRDCFKRDSLFYRKLKKCLIDGIKIEVKILYHNLTQEEAFEYEVELIAKYGRIDLGTGCLCNLTEGGDGVGLANIGREYSFDTRIKMSKPKTEEEKELNALIKIARYGRPITAISITSGKPIFIFDSIRTVKKIGLVPSNVDSALSGKSKSSGYYYWRDATIRERNRLGANRYVRLF